ncbi:unnamed protein product [Acanthosepion pharaonis]|uniref:HMG box domain-containing protein n=1 Tax=Acanthosepion pharaonis TaxID=158019 RepID=A0A812ALV7_ACAPH|nr:unnamed protein product [Sepia pharaonis]
MSSTRRKRTITETDDTNVMPLKKKPLKPEEISDHEDEFSQTSVLFEIENVTSTPTKKKKKKHRELDETNLQKVTEDGIKNTSTENVAENSVLSEAVEMPAKKKKKKSKKNNSTENVVDDEEHLAVSEDQNDEAKNVDKEKIDTELSFSETKRMFDDIQQKLMSSKFVNSKSFWDKYSFHPYSNENCRSAFNKIMSKVQKKRTMLELVSAAGKLMEISKKHPEYRGIQILNKLTKKWAKLSDHKKLKYIDLALAKRDDYMEEIKHCYQIDPSFVAKPILSKGEWQLKDRCSGLPDSLLLSFCILHFSCFSCNLSSHSFFHSLSLSHIMDFYLSLPHHGFLPLSPTSWIFTSLSHIMDFYLSLPHHGFLPLSPTSWIFTSLSHIMDFYLSLPHHGFLPLSPTSLIFSSLSHIIDFSSLSTSLIFPLSPTSLIFFSLSHIIDFSSLSPTSLIFLLSLPHH